MVGFSSIFNSITVMGFMIIIGVIVELKLKTLPEAKAMIPFLIINIAVPSVILNGIFNSEITAEKLSIFALIFICSILFNASGVLIGYMISRLFRWQTKTARLMAAMGGIGNSGFVGIPLCASIFGPTGGLYASIYDAGVAASLFSYGILLIQQEKAISWKSLKNIINPPIIALIIGLILGAIKYQPVTVFKQLVDNLSGLAAPLAMLYIGLVIPNILKKLKENKFINLTWIPIFTKLMIMPLLAISILQLFPIEKTIKVIIVIQTAVPVFLLASVLFARYGHDENYGTISIIYSTIAALITIPLITLLANLIL